MPSKATADKENTFVDDLDALLGQDISVNESVDGEFTTGDIDELLDDDSLEVDTSPVSTNTKTRGRNSKKIKTSSDLETKKRKKLTSRTLKTQMDRVLTGTPKAVEYDAIPFTQGEKTLYLCSVPFRDLQYLNCFDVESLPAEMRSQREITPSRAIKIANYLIERHEHNQPYIFNAATVGIDCSMADGETFSYEDGKLLIPAEAFLSIYDGQHRISGIIVAYASDPEAYIDDCLPVIFTGYKSLQEAQQLFSDINAHAAKVNSSLTKLYDHTDKGADIVRKLLTGVPFLRSHVDKERTTVSPKGSDIFTIISLDNFVKYMFDGVDDITDDTKVSIASRYWNILINNIAEFKQVADKKLAVSDMRQNTVFSSAAVIESFGMIFNVFYCNDADTWEEKISELTFNSIDWDKVGSHWQNVLIIGGRMSKSKKTVEALSQLIVDMAS